MKKQWYKSLFKNYTKNKLRLLSIFWSLFIGIGAFWGSAMMFIDPSGKIWGMDLLLPYMQKLPWSDIFFQNFIFPGIALLLANGITNLVSFILICINHRYAALSAMICGVILMLWIIVQFLVFPFNFMSTLYFVFGLLQVLTGYGYLKVSGKAGMTNSKLKNNKRSIRMINKI
jgi:hypothetical protein